ncbi:MAG TPA: chemotaxis protein CheA [Terriglobales bacterium]|jgi:two-component system chemotaxis sensor kinase CheA
MSHFSDERGAELRELFFETAQELLQSLNDCALKLEKNPQDTETVREIRRSVHTLKGDAAACSFRELSEAAHELEDALALEAIPEGTSLAEVAFTAADTFSAMLDAYRRRKKPPAADSLHKMVRLLAAGEKATGGKKKAAKRHAGQTVWTEYEELAIQDSLALGRHVYHIVATIDAHCAMPIAARQLVLNALRGTGDVLGTRPEPGSAAASKQVELLFASSASVEQIAAKCSIPTVIAETRVLAVERKLTAPVEAPKSAAPQAGRVEEEAGGKTQAQHSSSETLLRVDAERIDNVLNLVGELIIGKSMLQQALNEFGRRFPKDALRNRLADAMGFQSRVLNDLQRSVMKIRMVPVEQLFRRFPRMVRDVAKQCGRQVELTMRGQDTDLDKSLLDAIAEPLTHLVRNAISHGIERPEERSRAGKPPFGSIQLNSYHQGNQVIVEVSDDGHGIDAQRVKTKAIQQAVISQEAADRLSPDEVLDLVFRPGLSTADEITEVAGRGVGLDVVHSVLQRLKGSVEIETRVGQGTTFRLKLPLTLAIIKALLFRVEQRLYAIPLNAVAEIARARQSDLHQVERYEVLQLRNRALPVIRLGRPPDENNLAQKVFVLVMAVGERKLGLIVDSLEGEEELVIKALDDQTVETDLVSGASILGDGRVVLILNLAAIVERSTKQRPEATGKVMSGLLLSQADRARLTLESAEVRS